jgi:hypothetical protein
MIIDIIPKARQVLVNYLTVTFMFFVVGLYLMLKVFPIKIEETEFYDG